MQVGMYGCVGLFESIDDCVEFLKKNFDQDSSSENYYPDECHILNLNNMQTLVRSHRSFDLDNKWTYLLGQFEESEKFQKMFTVFEKLELQNQVGKQGDKTTKSKSL